MEVLIIVIAKIFNTRIPVPCSIFELMQGVKAKSSKYINDHQLIKKRFEWQEAYGAFSYSHSQIDDVYQYISNQEARHRKKTFKAEYLDSLKRFEIEYDEKHLFKFIE